MVNWKLCKQEWWWPQWGPIPVFAWGDLKKTAKTLNQASWCCGCDSLWQPPKYMPHYCYTNLQGLQCHNTANSSFYVLSTITSNLTFQIQFISTATDKKSSFSLFSFSSEIHSLTCYWGSGNCHCTCKSKGYKYVITWILLPCFLVATVDTDSICVHSSPWKHLQAMEI